MRIAGAYLHLWFIKPEHDFLDVWRCPISCPDMLWKPTSSWLLAYSSGCLHYCKVVELPLTEPAVHYQDFIPLWDGKATLFLSCIGCLTADNSAHICIGVGCHSCMSQWQQRHPGVLSACWKMTLFGFQIYHCKLEEWKVWGNEG